MESFEELETESVGNIPERSPVEVIPKARPVGMNVESPVVHEIQEEHQPQSSMDGDVLIEGSSSRLERQIFQDGSSSYLFKVDPRFVQDCYNHDQNWDREFRKYIGENYPYTMSPKTSEMIAKLSGEVKGLMSKAGFQVSPWTVGNEDEPYVMGVLRRVMVTDTIEPIISYVTEMAKHLKEVSEKDPSHVPTIRSFFCGACVADKCLLARLREFGVSANIISTDLKADSVAVAALNLSVWNELLPEANRYEIHIVKGKIPEELYSRKGTIILQVEDALEASFVESLSPHKFDALLVDNGLQYVSPEFTNSLITNVSSNIGRHGLYIGTLGLDSGIKVEIPTTHHIGEIARSLLVDLRKDYGRKSKYNVDYGYPHTYSFKMKEGGNILIDGVVSDGAARMYTWLRNLLINDRKRFQEVMSAVKSATELSKATQAVETSPVAYHEAMVSALARKGLVVDVKEKPINLEDYGWEKRPDGMYSNGKDVVDGMTAYEYCKREDPLVLRVSRIFVEPTQ